jgi:hypothetical protein
LSWFSKRAKAKYKGKDKTRQDKTRQDKTTQHKDKTGQDKTRPEDKAFKKK